MLWCATVPSRVTTLAATRCSARSIGVVANRSSCLGEAVPGAGRRVRRSAPTTERNSIKRIANLQVFTGNVELLVEAEPPQLEWMYATVQDTGTRIAEAHTLTGQAGRQLRMSSDQLLSVRRRQEPTEVTNGLSAREGRASPSKKPLKRAILEGFTPLKVLSRSLTPFLSPNCLAR